VRNDKASSFSGRTWGLAGQLGADRIGNKGLCGMDVQECLMEVGSTVCLSI